MARISRVQSAPITPRVPRIARRLRWERAVRSRSHGSSACKQSAGRRRIAPAKGSTAGHHSPPKERPLARSRRSLAATRTRIFRSTPAARAIATRTTAALTSIARLTTRTIVARTDRMLPMRRYLCWLASTVGYHSYARLRRPLVAAGCCRPPWCLLCIPRTGK